MTTTLALRCFGLLLAAFALAGCSSFASVNNCIKNAPPPKAETPAKAEPTPEAESLAKADPTAKAASTPRADAASSADPTSWAERTSKPAPTTSSGCAPSRSAMPKPVRATLAVDGLRGNPRVLMLLALSGGGSRSAYLSTEAMIALRNFADGDLLAEVDVMSAVSGGTLPAAFYALTRDESLRIEPRVVHALDTAKNADAHSVPSQLSIDSKPRSMVTPIEHRLLCSKPLQREDLALLLQHKALSHNDVWRIRDFCDVAGLDGKLRVWDDDDARDRMGRNYVARMLGNFLWPTTFVRHWFTAYDRADVMAQTLADNLYDDPKFGIDHRFSDLNPARPILVLNATAGSQPSLVDEHVVNDELSFGSAFAFTLEEFSERVWSDLGDFPIANAVMASSAFPLAFPHVTLENFHTLRDEHRCAKRKRTLTKVWDSDNPWEMEEPCDDRRFLHLLDGGNSDNLGLRAVKRILLDMAVGERIEDYDSIIVVSIDAFTRPVGAQRNVSDPRSLVGRIADPSGVTDAVDALLQANRRKLLEEFGAAQSKDDGTPYRSVKLLDYGRDCEQEERHLPSALCRRLENADLPAARRALADRLVVHHFGFQNLQRSDPALYARLNRIPTSFSISSENKRDIRVAVASAMHGGNPCLQKIGELIWPKGDEDPDRVRRQARLACNGAGAAAGPAAPPPPVAGTPP